MLCWKNCGLLLLVMSRVTKTEKLVTAHNWVQATWQIYKGFSWCYCVLFYLAKFQVYIPFFIIVIDEMVLMTFWAVELPGTVSCLKSLRSTETKCVLHWAATRCQSLIWFLWFQHGNICLADRRQHAHHVLSCSFLAFVTLRVKLGSS